MPGCRFAGRLQAGAGKILAALVGKKAFQRHDPDFPQPGDGVGYFLRPAAFPPLCCMWGHADSPWDG